MTRNARRLIAVLGCVVTCLGVGACDSDGPQSMVGLQKITIGIHNDEPGLGYRESDGTYVGLDINIAQYVAEKLGFAPSDIIWKPLTSDEREPYLDEGKVDIVVASYSITDIRKGSGIVFAGPYLAAHQDVLIRASETNIKDEEDLKQKYVCSVTDSTSAQNLYNYFGGEWANRYLELQPSYSDCVNLLRAGNVSAVSTDNAILFGYVRQGGSPELRDLGLKLSDESYGIGLAAINAPFCRKINKILEGMIKSGVWLKFINVNFGPYADTFATPAPVGGNCE